MSTKFMDVLYIPPWRVYNPAVRYATAPRAKIHDDSPWFEAISAGILGVGEADDWFGLVSQ